MKKFIIAALALLLILALLPFNLQGNSQHNKYTNTIYCKSDSDCWHEIGHLMDDRTGHPSQSAEFGAAVATYLYVTIPQLQGKLDPFTEVIFTQSGMFQYDKGFSTPFGVGRSSSPQEELYARIYAYAYGDVSAIPLPFTPFYSTDPKYRELHDCLIASRVSLCGKALHIEK